MQKKITNKYNYFSAINLDPNYIKVLLRRAQLLENKEKFEEALKDYQKVLEIDPSCYKARAACMVKCCCS